MALDLEKIRMIDSLMPLDAKDRMESAIREIAIELWKEDYFDKNDILIYLEEEFFDQLLYYAEVEIDEIKAEEEREEALDGIAEQLGNLSESDLEKVLKKVGR